MNKILVCGCAESKCFVTMSKNVTLASSQRGLALYVNWRGSNLSESIPGSWSATALPPLTCKAARSRPLHWSVVLRVLCVCFF